MLFSKISILTLILTGLLALGWSPSTAYSQTSYQGTSLMAAADCLQKCFDQWQKNEERCYDTHCTNYILFKVCSTSRLNTCLDEALSIYLACKRGCLGGSVQS